MILQLFHELIVFLFPNDCFEELILKFNIFNRDCVRMVASRFLGAGIVLGASMVKVPQILKIVNEGSGVGVSVFSQLLELTAYTVSVMYSIRKRFHFSAWGESLFLSCQSLAIIALILWFERNFRKLFIVLVCYSAICLFYTWGWFSDDVVTIFQTLSILLVLSARSLQALENHRNQSTGQLSAVTFGLLLLGSLARIFTSIQETGDPVVITQYVISSTMNAIICWQIYAYWGRRMPLKKTE